MGTNFQELLDRLADEHYREIGEVTDELKRARSRLRQAGIPDDSWSTLLSPGSPHPSIAEEGANSRQVYGNRGIVVTPRTEMRSRQFVGSRQSSANAVPVDSKWCQPQRREAPMYNDTDSESITQGCQPNQICCNELELRNTGRISTRDQEMWYEAARVAQLNPLDERVGDFSVDLVKETDDVAGFGDQAPDEDVLERVTEVVETAMRMNEKAIHKSTRQKEPDSAPEDGEAELKAMNTGSLSSQNSRVLSPSNPFSNNSNTTSQTRAAQRSKSKVKANIRNLKSRTASMSMSSIDSDDHSDDQLASNPKYPAYLTVNPAWTDLAMWASFPTEIEKNAAPQNSFDINRLMDGSRRSAEQKRLHFKQRGRQGMGASLHNNLRPDFAKRKHCDVSTFISQPSSRGRLSWDITGMVLLAYDIIMVPVQVFEPSESVFLQLLNYVTGGFWTFDLIASFLVGYHIEGRVEMNPIKIAFHYIRSWFFLDLTLVLLDWVFLLISSESQGSSRVMRMGKLSRGMRVMRLLRVMKFRMVFSDIIESIHSEYTRTLIGVAKWVVFIIIINHYIACGFYGLKHIAHLTDEENTWVKVNLPDGSSFLYQYGTSMHWSLTQFTPASMEVVPENGSERIYNICVLLFALVTFSSFVSSITNAMTHLRNIDAKKLDQDAALRRYLGEHAINNALVNRVLHFFQERQVQKGRSSRTKEVDVELFKTLPESLKNELRFEALSPAVNSHPFFHHYGVVEPQALRQICRTAVTEISLTIREELFADGATVQHMIFLNEGQLRYQYPYEGDSDHVLISKGQWACEAALWAQNTELHSPLVALCTCELALFNSGDFIVCAKKYPATISVVVRYAELFMEDVQKEGSRCRWRSMLCNDFDRIHDLVHSAFSEFTKSHEEDDEASDVEDGDPESHRSVGVISTPTSYYKGARKRSTMTGKSVVPWFFKSWSQSSMPRFSGGGRLSGGS